MGERKPGVICGAQLGNNWIDEGTLCRSRSNPPFGTGLSEKDRLKSNPWKALGSQDPGLQGALIGPLLERYFVEVRLSKDFQEWVGKYYAEEAICNSKSSFNEGAVYPEWYFNHELSPVKRNSLLCVSKKMMREGLWSHVKRILWCGSNGEIDFYSKEDSSAFYKYLLSNGYGDWCFAKGKDDEWGVRSQRKGCELHFRGSKNDRQKMNGHIDVHNPGKAILSDYIPDPGRPEMGISPETPDPVIHHLEDKIKRASTHTPDKMRAALRGQGIGVPRVP